MKEGLSPCFLNEGEECCQQERGAKRGTWQMCGDAGKSVPPWDSHVRSLLLSLSCEACWGTHPNRVSLLLLSGGRVPAEEGSADLPVPRLWELSPRGTWQSRQARRRCGFLSSFLVLWCPKPSWSSPSPSPQQHKSNAVNYSFIVEWSTFQSQVAGHLLSEFPRAKAHICGSTSLSDQS